MTGKTNYIQINLNLSKARAEKYLTALRNRYNRPKSGWSRLILCVLREAIYMQEQGIPAHGKTK
jgi:hypothetical protein